MLFNEMCSLSLLFERGNFRIASTTLLVACIIVLFIPSMVIEEPSSELTESDFAEALHNSFALKVVHICSIFSTIPLVIELILDYCSNVKGLYYADRIAMITAIIFPSSIYLIFRHSIGIPLVYNAMINSQFMAIIHVVITYFADSSPDHRLPMYVYYLGISSNYFSNIFQVFSLGYIHYADALNTVSNVLYYISVAALLFLTYSWINYMMNNSISKDDSRYNNYIICITYMSCLWLSVFAVLAANAMVSFGSSYDLNPPSLITYACIFVIFAIVISILPGRLVRMNASSTEATLAMKRVFVRYVSHEIRSPLNVVYAGLEYLRVKIKEYPEQFDEDLFELLDEILVANDSAVHILNDLLHYESMDAGTFTVDLAWRPVRNLLVKRIQPLEMLADKHDVTLHLIDKVGITDSMNGVVHDDEESRISVLTSSDLNDNPKTDQSNPRSLESSRRLSFSSNSNKGGGGSSSSHFIKTETGGLKAGIADEDSPTKETAKAKRLIFSKQSLLSSTSIETNDLALRKGAVLLDVYRFEQVIRNLITSAIKFTPVNGTVIIEFDAVPLKGDQFPSFIEESEVARVNGVLKSQRDGQIGLLRVRIGSQSLEALSSFGFGSTDAIPTDLSHGLGIWICKKIVELHGGYIKIDSPTANACDGLNFTFYLPLYSKMSYNKSATSDNVVASESNGVEHHNRSDLPLESFMRHVSKEAEQKERRVRKQWFQFSLFSSESRHVESDATEENDAGIRPFTPPIADKPEAISSQNEAAVVTSLPPAEPEYPPLAITKPSLTLVLRILIVDDSAMNRKVLRRLVETSLVGLTTNRPFTVEMFEADDGVPAVEALRQQELLGKPILLVFIDYLMKTMHGPETILLMRGKENFSGRIVGITGNAMPEDVSALIISGADNVLLKPVSVSSIAGELLKAANPLS